MSWIKSASKFLDELDNEAGQAAKEGVVAKTAEGVLERAKLEVVKTLATVEDQGIFEDSDEEGAEQAGTASEREAAAGSASAAVAPLPPPPEAAVRFKPTLSSAAKAAPEPATPTKTATPAAGEAAAVQPEPELEPLHRRDLADAGTARGARRRAGILAGHGCRGAESVPVPDPAPQQRLAALPRLSSLSSSSSRVGAGAGAGQCARAGARAGDFFRLKPNAN